MSEIKNKTEVVLRLSSNMIGDDETNFSHKLLLIFRQVANLRKAFADKSLTDNNLSKTQISKVQSRGFFSRILGPILKTGLPLMKNLIKPLAKSVLIPLGLSAAASPADVGIHKKSLNNNNNNNTILTISNDEMKKIVKIVESFEYSSLLLGELAKQF